MKRPYLIALHLLVAALIAFPDGVGRVESALGIGREAHRLQEYYYLRTIDHHLYRDGSVPPGSVLIFGDSLAQGLHAPSVAPNAVGYGIGGDTAAGALRRLPRYRSVDRAGAVVLAFGANDVEAFDDETIVRNFRELVAAIPTSVPVVIGAALPVDEPLQRAGSGRRQARLARLNASLRRLAESSPRLSHVDVWDRLIDARGQLADRFHTGDGVHLSPAGYALWSAALRRAVARALGAAAPEAGAPLPRASARAAG